VVSAVSLEALAAASPSRARPTPTELAAALGALGGRWSVAGKDLRLDLAAPMTKTGQVAAFAGALADELDHHPNISLEYAGLVLAIHTHDADAITRLDLVYAARVEAWLRARGW
jgi:pterin-4a-carbinolamine dehydratase